MGRGGGGFRRSDGLRKHQGWSACGDVIRHGRIKAAMNMEDFQWPSEVLQEN